MLSLVVAPLSFACSSSSSGTTGAGGASSSASSTSSSTGGPSSSSSSSSTSSSTSSSGHGGQGAGGAGGGPPKGQATYLVAGYDLRRVVSTDGATWTHDVSDPPDPQMLDNIGDGIAFGRGIVAVVAHSGLVTSKDGAQWTKVGAPLPQKWPGLGGGKILFDGNQFVIIASDTSFLSQDGATWQQYQSMAGATHWNGFAFGNGHYVAVGDSNAQGGDRKVSEDGKAWHDFHEGGPAYRALAFGNGVFVAVGGNGLVQTTTDGVTWQDKSDPSLGDLGNLVFDGTRFLTCTQKCYTSQDGAQWTPHDAQNPPQGPIAFGLGLYLSISWESNIWTSPDGFAWTKAWSGMQGTPALQSVGFGYLGP